MRVQVTERHPKDVAGDVVVQLVRTPVSDPLPLHGHLSKRAAELVVPDRGSLTWLEPRRMKAPRVLTVSLGADGGAPAPPGFAGSPDGAQQQAAQRERLRGLGGSVERACFDHDAEHVVIAPPPEGVEILPFVEGMLLRSYGPEEFRSDDIATTLTRITVCTHGKDRVKPRVDAMVAMVESTNEARALADLPGNVGTPAEITKRATRRARQLGLKTRVLEQGDMRRLKMGLLLGVARGASSPAKVLILEHQPKPPKRVPTLVLVGKGVTHDTGGYNLKTSLHLHEQTYDKSGGMAVIGAMYAIARLQVPAKVVALVPLVENAIGKHAYKPGDILRAMDGTHVYIENTDAEGRLAMADCLTYAKRFKPTMVVDIATLTHAASVALGEPFSGLFCNDDSARDLLVQAGLQTGELVWPMPIHPVHRQSLGDHKADMRNSGYRSGSACSASAFLRHFACYPWAHVDMAGKSHWYGDHEFLASGASGWGCRLLTRFTQGFAETFANKTSGPKGRRGHNS